MQTNYFEINIDCAGCKDAIEKSFKKYPDIKITINVMEKMLKVECDETKYSNEFIIEIVKKAGYIATEM